MGHHLAACLPNLDIAKPDALVDPVHVEGAAVDGVHPHPAHTHHAASYGSAAHHPAHTHPHVEHEPASARGTRGIKPHMAGQARRHRAARARRRPRFQAQHGARPRRAEAAHPAHHATHHHHRQVGVWAGSQRHRPPVREVHQHLGALTGRKPDCPQLDRRLEQPPTLAIQ